MYCYFPFLSQLPPPKKKYYITFPRSIQEDAEENTFAGFAWGFKKKTREFGGKKSLHKPPETRISPLVLENFPMSNGGGDLKMR